MGLEDPGQPDIICLARDYYLFDHQVTKEARRNDEKRL
jgi:hypothetical protein